MYKKTFILAFTLAMCAHAYALTLIQGAVDNREAKILVQTTGSQPISISKKGEKAPLYTATADEYGLAKFTLKNLLPNTSYEFVATDSASSEEFTVKTTADYLDRTPPPDVKFAVIGKVHRNDPTFDPPFKTPGGDYEIFDVIANQKCDAVIWANNAAQMRPSDYRSFSAIMNRYNFERSIPEMSRLLKSTANYALLSSDSFGAPNSDKWLWNKSEFLDAFNRNWANPTPIKTKESNVATCFRISDVEVFLLDSISNRNNFDYEEFLPEMFGKEQLYWLLNALKNSTAKFKIVVSNSPMINPAEANKNFAKYNRERKVFLDFILKNRITGLVFASSNKNYSEITKLVRPSAYELFELSTGATTDRPAQKASEMNFFRIPSSTTFERSFSTISVSGEENSRVLTLTIYNAKGEKEFSQDIKESTLSHFE